MSMPLLSLLPILGRPFVGSPLEALGPWVARLSALPAVAPDALVHTAIGLEVCLSSDSIVETVFLHGWGHERFAQYSGPLPEGLTFASSRKEVRTVFGRPSSSADEQVLEYLGPIGAWDRYDLPAAHLHFQYRMSEPGIVLITLMARGTAPGA
jgi:hypothetical protein